MIFNYLTILCQEGRQLLAKLGVARFDDLVGRADLLQAVEGSQVDLAPLLVASPGRSLQTGQKTQYAHSQLAQQILVEAEQALRGERSVLIQHPIANYDRSIGASLAGEIARRYGNTGLPGVSITCVLQGSAGQSVGAFFLPGMRMVLHGEANEYGGKSMTGGRNFIAPPHEPRFAAHSHI